LPDSKLAKIRFDYILSTNVCDLSIEHRRHVIQIVIEEVRVNIESHGR
jgi:hypothetical protein